MIRLGGGGRLAWCCAGWLAISACAVGASPLPAPVPRVRTLDNGLRVAVFPNARLPIVQVQLLVAAGSSDEPADALGVAAMTAELLRMGTSSRPARDYARDVAALGGTVTAGAFRDYSVLSGAFLARDLEAGLELVSDAALHPVFPVEEVERMRRQALSSLYSSHRNAGTLAEEHAAALVFGTHPYSRPALGTVQSLPAVGVDQVQSFYRRTYRPGRAWLAIAGDVDPERAFRAAEARFGGWTAKGGVPAAAIASPPSPTAKVRVIDVPGATRAEVRMAWPASARAADDALPLTAAVEMLAGTSSGQRLAALGRRGAFAVPPRFGLSLHREAGVAMIGCAAPVDSVGAAVRAIADELRRFGHGPWPADEISRTAQRLGAAHAMQFETLGGTVGTWLAAQAESVSWRQVAATPERLAALSGQQIGAAAVRWLDPSRACLVVTGPADKLRRQLEGWGTAEVVAVNTPSVSAQARPTTVTTTPTLEQLTRGRRQVERAVEAHGGLAKLRGVKDSTIEGDVVMMSEGRQLNGTLRQTRKEPYRMSFMTDFFTFETHQVLDGDRAWARSGGELGASEVQDLDSTSVAALRFAFASDVPHLLVRASDPGARAAWRGRETLAGRDAEVVEVVPADGERIVLLFDVETGLLVGLEQNDGETGAGRFTRRVYQDFHPVQGIQWPFYEERLQNGQRLMSLKLKKVQINGGVQDGLFKRPANP
jgi:predicted Zn-dependent peptidase